MSTSRRSSTSSRSSPGCGGLLNGFQSDDGILHIPDVPPEVPRRPPSRGLRRETLEDISRRIPLDVMLPYFNYPLRRAAQAMNISVTTLKRLCRRHGVKRWPHRQISGINRAIKHLERQSSTNSLRNPSSSLSNQLNQLHRRREIIVEMAMADDDNDAGASFAFGASSSNSSPANEEIGFDSESNESSSNHALESPHSLTGVPGGILAQHGSGGGSPHPPNLLPATPPQDSFLLSDQAVAPLHGSAPELVTAESTLDRASNNAHWSFSSSPISMTGCYPASIGIGGGASNSSRSSEPVHSLDLLPTCNVSMWSLLLPPPAIPVGLLSSPVYGMGTGRPSQQHQVSVEQALGVTAAVVDSQMEEMASLEELLLSPTTASNDLDSPKSEKDSGTPQVFDRSLMPSCPHSSWGDKQSRP